MSTECLFSVIGIGGANTECLALGSVFGVFDFGIIASGSSSEAKISVRFAMLNESKEATSDIELKLRAALLVVTLFCIIAVSL